MLLYLVDGEQVRLTTQRQLALELYGSLAENDGRDFTDELSSERQAEARRENLDACPVSGPPAP